MSANDQTEARADERHAGAQLVFFLCFTEPTTLSAEEMRPHLDAHKRWIVEQERSGRLPSDAWRTGAAFGWPPPLRGSW